MSLTLSGAQDRWRRRWRPLRFEWLENRRLLAGDLLDQDDPLTSPEDDPAAETASTMNVYPLVETPIHGDTRHKPQSKVWLHDDRWWTVAADDSGTWLRRLDGLAWTPVLRLSTEDYKADVKPIGDVAHVFLFGGGTSYLASVQYVPDALGTYQFWSQRPGLSVVSLGSGVETGTIDVDSLGRMWVASDAETDVEVRYSDYPYATWSDPIIVAQGIDTDDISVVTAMADDSIGVLWSDQVTQRFGFRVHHDGDAPELWSADEVPAAQSALDAGAGMADDHLNVAVASDGTLYAAVKTGYDTAGFTRIGLLVRRPSGAWDPLYEVDTVGTRPIVVLSEVQDRLLVVYRESDESGPIVYRESSLSSIAFGPKQTLIPGDSQNNVSSIKDNFTDQLVVIATGDGMLTGVLLADGPPQNRAPVVDAGLDRTIFDVQTVDLDADVDDDGLPVPANLATTWTLAGGPVGGAVTFGDASSPDTTAAFTAVGDYVLRLTANDGELETFDEVTISVVPTPVNQPPTVDAGPDQTIYEYEFAVLNGTVSDDGLPWPPTLTTTWTVLQTPVGGTVTFADASMVDTTAAFSTPGEYTLRLTAGDGEQETYDDLAVTVEKTPSIVTRTFRDGVNGYTETRDAGIKSDQPDKNYSANSSLQLHGTLDRAALLKWDLSEIPAGNRVQSVTLAVNALDRSRSVYQVYAVKRDWAEDQVTWNSAAAGDPWEIPGVQGGSDRGSEVLGTITAPATGPVTVEFNAAGVALVQSWIDDPATNFGVVLQNYDNTDGLKFSSRESTTAAVRPQLTVTYAAPHVNSPPVLPPIGNKSVDEGNRLSFAVSAIDADQDDVLTYSAVDLPPGAAFDPETQVFDWTPSEDRDGSYDVTFSVSDGEEAVSETITITVAEANQPPVLAPIGDRVVDKGSSLNFTISATDADLVGGLPNALTYSAADLPSGATFDPSTQTFDWTPREDQVGTHDVAFHVSDGDSTVSQPVTITVGPLIFEPLADKSVDEGTLLSFAVSAADASGQPSPLVYSADGLPSGAVFDPDARTFAWTPLESQDGQYGVTFTVSNGVDTAAETITITVDEVNQPFLRSEQPDLRLDTRRKPGRHARRHVHRQRRRRYGFGDDHDHRGPTIGSNHGLLPGWRVRGRHLRRHAGHQDQARPPYEELRDRHGVGSRRRTLEGRVDPVGSRQHRPGQHRGIRFFGVRYHRENEGYL